MLDLEFEVPSMGERRDLTDRELPIAALRVSQNVFRSEKGRLAIRPGYDLLSATNPGGRIMGVGYFRTAASAEKQLVANQTGVWAYNGTIWTDITLGGSALTGSNTDHVRFTSMAVAGTYKSIITNGKDTPKIWDGAAATYSNVAGSPGVSIASTVAANRLLLLQAPNIVKVSEFNNPESYPSGAGFTANLVDAGDLMVGIERLSRTAVAILGEESQWVGRAQTGSSPFRYDKVDEKRGPISVACIVRIGGLIYYLGEDYNIYRFDGTSCQEVGWAMKPWIRDNISLANKKMSHGVYLDRIGKIFWFFPGSGQSGPGMGVHFDPRTGEMGRLVYGNSITASGRIRATTNVTWNDLVSYTWENVEAAYPAWESFGDAAAERRVALGDSSGNVHAVDVGDGSDNGSPISVSWEVPLKAYAGWPNNTVPDTFETFFRKSANPTTVSLALGTTDTLMADPTYTDFGSFDISTDQRNDIDLTGVGEKRFVTIRHSANATKGQIEWQGGIFRAQKAEVEKGPVG